jgi:hypothetical protein
VLEFQSNEPRKADPLMGWAGSGDTQSQVQLTFPSLDAARAFAEKKGIRATFIPTPPKTLSFKPMRIISVKQSYPAASEA